MTNTPPASPVKGTRLELLDLTRFVAAIMVVAFHWTYHGLVEGYITSDFEMGAIAQVAQFGFWGVTLFFLLSGFVISNSVKGKTPRQFVTSRLTRLYPSFWVAVILTGGASLLQTHPMFEVGIRQILANLTMIPSWLGYRYVDGVYWTLEIEMAFYAVILVAMFTIGSRHITNLMMFWIALLAALAVLDTAAPGFFAPPMLLSTPFVAFALGAVIAAIVTDGDTWPRWVAVVAGTGVLIRDEILVAVERGERLGWEPAPIAVALLMIAFVGLFLLHRSPRVRALRIPGAGLLGGLSYPLYLLHAYLGYMVLNAVATPENYIGVYAGLLLAMLFASWLLREFVEVRPHRFWKRLFDSTAGRFVGFLWDGRQKLVTELLRRRRPVEATASKQGARQHTR